MLVKKRSTAVSVNDGSEGRAVGAPDIDQKFVRMALGAAVVTFLMITIGAITRVTESGYGCGPYWPSCNGHLIPEFHDMTVVIEYGHRLFALIVGLFAGIVAVMAWRNYRGEPRIFYPAMAGFGLFFVQSGLGAVTVALYQYAPNSQWVSVMIHLGNSMFLLAAYLVTWVNARRILGLAVDTPLGTRQSIQIVLPPIQLLLATALSFLVAMIGAAVAGTNATKACVGWPLCGGEIWPAAQGPLQTLNMLHRIVAGALGLLLILMVIQARGASSRALRAALVAALGVYLAQAAIGASVVLVENRDWLVATRALHVTFAAATWAAMIIASTASWLQFLPSAATSRQVHPVAASSATTSS